MTQHREKFATQMDSVLLSDLRQMAKSEGRQIQALLEEAVQAFLEEKNGLKPAADVMALAERITDDYSETLKYLAQ